MRAKGNKKGVWLTSSDSQSCTSLCAVAPPRDIVQSHANGPRDRESVTPARPKGLKRSLTSVVALLVLSLAGVSSLTARVSDESEVRGTVQRVFQQLKSKDYDGLYDVLPSSSRSRMSRERFTSALKRAQGIYALERMEVGPVRVAGNFAVVDTVLYGRVVIPMETEGKIVVQQYLVREDGKWRVATGDRAAVRRFLAANPAFSKSFSLRQPRVYVKQNGKWVEFNAPRSGK